ncbi:YwbE family protein [uncultured Polaribacter sp.]|uniref:YwbE family protein n=1 Tax=uncultured Polaribacter sp. TaxID=174711 RepID=UPI0026174218|nr:YwbE family protein [uncultured Polaribacter sp.]
MVDARKRDNIKVGQFVKIVKKQHQITGETTEGTVGEILTKSPNHPYGIKVKLVSGLVGRVKEIIE